MKNTRLHQTRNHNIVVFMTQLYNEPLPCKSVRFRIGHQSTLRTKSYARTARNKTKYFVDYNIINKYHILLSAELIEVGNSVSSIFISVIIIYA